MEYVQEKMNAKAIQELPLEIVLLGLEFVAFTSKVKIHKTKHVMSENNTFHTGFTHYVHVLFYVFSLYL